MKRKTQKEFNAFHLFAGLLIGFLLGSTLVYWHNNRQNDRLIAEAVDKVIGLFSDHGIFLAENDSVWMQSNGQISTLNPPRQTVSPALPFSAENPNLLAQDRFLYSKNILIRKTPKKEYLTDRKLDSLIGNTTPVNNKDIFIIEFWESPLNSTGYKMGKNKIILYGIHSFDMVSLEEHNNQIYLKYFNELYPLEHTTSFKPLVQVNEPFDLRDLHAY